MTAALDVFSILQLLLLVQSLCRVQLFVTPWTAARQAPLSSSVSRSLLRFMSPELVRPCKYLILCCLLLLPLIFPNTRVFSNESALCIRWQKYWNFSHFLSIPPILALISRGPHHSACLARPISVMHVCVTFSSPTQLSVLVSTCPCV